MRLLVADDHTLFRDALVQYIERSESDVSITVAKDFYDCMDVLARGAPFDLVLLDLRMPGMRGLNGFKEINAKYPTLRLALMSGMAELVDVRGALDAGAVGYFPKTMSGKALLTGIRHIMAGNIFVPKDSKTDAFMPSHYEDEDDEDDARIDTTQGDITSVDIEKIKDVTFAPREGEVLSYLLDGASNKEIARAMNLQVVTIKLHLRGICKKLDAKNRTQAALKARALGIKSYSKIQSSKAGGHGG